ncbi:hypothetical protein HZC31_04665 [Candidatus Woesearchaeota archaeon]|nr:hypothetical protein [Candidatus Woesearchaeota archaeon]
MNLLDSLEKLVTDNTVIDAGHYSYKVTPTVLDLFLWERGVELYAKTKDLYQNVGLLLLVDDVRGMASNEERRSYDITQLPACYQMILDKHAIASSDVIIVSQSKLRDKGRQLLRAKKISRSSVPRCQLIIATLVRYKENRGYESTIAFYDTLKTNGGKTLSGGTVLSYVLFDTTLKTTLMIYDKIGECKQMYFSNTKKRL